MYVYMLLEFVDSEVHEAMYNPLNWVKMMITGP